MATRSSELRSNHIKCGLLWVLEPSDMLELETWPEEQTQMLMIFDTYAQLPKVLGKIIIAYSGAAYADALVTLGKSHELKKLVNECKLGSNKYSHRVAGFILTVIGKTIGIETPPEYVCNKVRDIIVNLPKPDISEERDYVADFKRCETFHKIILTYFSTPLAPPALLKSEQVRR